MHVIRGIRSDMVVAMVAGPPEGAALGAGASQDRKYELNGARSFEGSMSEVSMIPACDGKHAQEIKGDRYGDGHPTPANPDDAEAHQMNRNEWDAAEPIDLRWALHLCLFETGP